MNSLQRIKRAEVGPIVPRVVRTEIVQKTRISYHVAEEESTYSKAEIWNLSRGNTPELPLKEVKVTEEEGREREERTDELTDEERIRNGISQIFNALFSYNIQNFHNSGSSWQAEAISRRL